MKHQIRKTEAITIYRATKVIVLDDKKFRKLDENPYTGDSPEEFMQYLAAMNFAEPPYDLDDDTQELMQELAESEYVEYGSSAEKGSEIYLQIGEQDESYRKTGGFRVIDQTESNLDY
jgi:hypothetical protein